MITLSFPPVVDGLEATQAKFTKVNATYLAPMINVLNVSADAGRKIAKAQKALSSFITLVRHQLGRVDADCAFGDDYSSRFILVDLYAQFERIYLNKNVPSAVKLAETLFDSIHQMHTAANTLARNGLVLAEYTKASREVNQLSAVVTKLETAAKSNPIEEVVQKLSEVYFKYEEASKVAQQKASNYNYTIASLQSELEHFQSYHSSQLLPVLNGYVASQLEAERDCLALAEAAIILLQ
ncbi:hypothetical protein HDU99_004155 [Rhizoclosmatium hyalinum]|nr:hypothetical protein HDU99_004155 [Rhizoclosmatium hyalinum]